MKSPGLSPGALPYLVGDEVITSLVSAGATLLGERNTLGCSCTHDGGVTEGFGILWPEVLDQPFKQLRNNLVLCI